MKALSLPLWLSDFHVTSYNKVGACEKTLYNQACI